MTELAKTFDPAEIESRWYAHWESEGLFRPSRPDATPFTIVMPPPNVTGSLHIGHALDNTLQDILTRIARLQGKDALWVVGMDHAGIATQMVVERQLDLEQKKRTDFTRDEFVARVWEWKNESGGQITRQLRRLGASCDWSNERFTMDEGFSKAVTHVFVELHRRGLLYRDKRLVNWDPHFQTAISDLEVETRDTAGKFWTLRYPLADGSGHIEVATTRPETMLADMAVAVHPTDERYTALVGKMIRLPITGREIPIVADEHADPELGSGAVKVTPGHDFNDYEVGKRAGFKPAEMLNMFDAAARVVQSGGIPDALLGLDRFDARKAVVDLLDSEGALVKVEDRQIATPYGDRSNVVIEPWLTDQWYVDAATLVKPVIEATRAGKIKIVPESWSKTWFNWLENIQPWCVSRQLWWGHRIPAWFGPPLSAFIEDGEYLAELVTHDFEVFVAESEGEALAQAEQFYRSKVSTVRGIEFKFADLIGLAQTPENWTVQISRETDVLDTWFSSALWPFATLGWPEESSSPLVGEAGGGRDASASQETLSAADAAGPPPQPSPQGGGRKSDLARHYPNDVLISGFDILFFWDARMAMQGMEFMKEVPWKTLYLHGLVRDAQGAKMSKSKGNTVDPLGLIDRYGADALRFTMAAMESQGRDIKLDEKRVEGYRNFATKLWNAARFLQGNGVGASKDIKAPPASLPVNRWIIGEVVATLDAMNKAIADLRFDDMAAAIYHFTWGTFCDWYVELVKGAWDDETKQVAAWAFDQILVMLHPLMPFITEELWHSMGRRPYDLIVAKWPEPQFGAHPDQAEWDDARRTLSSGPRDVILPASPNYDLDAVGKWLVETKIELIREIRAVRSELSIPWTVTLKPVVLMADAYDGTLIEILEDDPAVARMARIAEASVAEQAPANSVQIVVRDFTIALPLEGVIDLDAEKSRLAKAIAVAEKDRDGLAARLANPAFTDRAKPEAVEKARADHDARAAEAERLSAALARLG